MKKCLIPILVSLMSCGGIQNKSSSGVHWTNVKFEGFSLKAPANWRKVKLHGIDSYVGGLTNGKDTLTFDFGQYSSDLTEDAEKQLYAKDTINGKIGVITRPKIKGNGVVGVYFGNIDGDRFNLYTWNSTNEDTLILIFQSLKFKSSDTAVNSKRLVFSGLSGE